MTYDITDATMDGAQEPHRVIDFARICGLPHEYSDDSGIGIVLYDRGEDGEGAKRCEHCIEIRDDYRGWMLVNGYRVAA